MKITVIDIYKMPIIANITHYPDPPIIGKELEMKISMINLGELNLTYKWNITDTLGNKAYGTLASEKWNSSTYRFVPTAKQYNCTITVYEPLQNATLTGQITIYPQVQLLNIRIDIPESIAQGTNLTGMVYVTNIGDLSNFKFVTKYWIEYNEKQIGKIYELREELIALFKTQYINYNTEKLNPASYMLIVQARTDTGQIITEKKEIEVTPKLIYQFQEERRKVAFSFLSSIIIGGCVFVMLKTRQPLPQYTKVQRTIALLGGIGAWVIGMWVF